MENVSNELKCYCCKSVYNETDKFCGICGYPLQGTPEEQKQFSINYSVNNFEKDIVKDRIKEARIVLFIISVFTIIQSFILYFSEPNVVLLIINLILAGIYAGLGFWAKQKAFAAILTGGIIYVSIILLSAFFDPLTIFKGIIFKVLFIIGFIRAAYGAYKYKVS